MKTLCKNGQRAISPGQVIKNGLRSTFGRLLPKGYGLATTRREWGRKKGPKAISLGQVIKNGLKGQPMEQRKATGKATGRRVSGRFVEDPLTAEGGNGRPKVGNEQCELAQTLPSRERLRVGEHSSGIRGRRSQQAISPEQVIKNGLKGQRAVSPGHRPGYTTSAANALQGQKNLFCNIAFALSCVPSVASDQRSSAGRSPYHRFYPGRCPGLTAFALSGRSSFHRFYPGRCPGLTAFALSGRAPYHRFYLGRYPGLTSFATWGVPLLIILPFVPLGR